jgi:hypothetical protein
VNNQKLIKELQRDITRRKRERKKAEDKKHHALVSWLDGYITACEILLVRLCMHEDNQ